MMTPKAKIACVALLLCASCADGLPQTPAADGLVPSAQTKTATRYIVAKDSTRKWTCHTRFPMRGAVVSYGGFLSRGATFDMVDIDRRTIRRINIDAPPLVAGQNLDHRSMRQVIWFDRSVSLSPSELNPLIIRMNHLWRHGSSRRPELQPVDAVTSVVLLDGDTVFDDSQSPFHSPDKVLMDAVVALAHQHGLTGRLGTATDATCDPEPAP